MGSLLKVQWTVVPRVSPRPLLACSRCGGVTPFQSSGKMRLNANGKKLDAWLIYKCVCCGNTWNRPVFERRNVRDIDQATLDALHSNDPDFIRRLEFDVAPPQWKAQHTNECEEIDVYKRILDNDDGSAAILAIELIVPWPTALRLDRFLAAELRLSRARLQALEKSAALKIEPNHRHALRRPLKHGSRIMLDLAKAADLPGVRDALNSSGFFARF
jgi:hypothetical protein